MPAGNPAPETGRIVAIVKGGLGNQLFIYAAARSLALRTGRKLYLDAKLGYAADMYDRSYRLDRFPVIAESMREEWQIAPSLRHFTHKWVRAYSKFFPRDLRSYVAERRNLAASQLTELHPRVRQVTLNGYWQNEAYFKAHADVIRRELSPPEPVDRRNHSLAARMTAQASVFLHVRRVRYNPHLGSDYYQKAINLMLSRKSGLRFYLFGDDLKWPMQALNFRGSEVFCMDHNQANELDDLWLMTKCHHAILANSSFSWWGAWLGPSHPDRIVITPAESGWPVRPAYGWHCVPNLLQTSDQ